MKILLKAQSEFQNIQLVINTLFSVKKERIENNVPYVSQFAHPEYSEKILKDGAEKTSDPSWKETGAESPDEYAKWVTTICGMACTAMALQYFKNQNVGIVALAKDALNHGVYEEHDSELSNMLYREYVDWIKNYGLRAKIYTRLSISGIQKILSDGGLVIVSVNPNIRGYQTAKVGQKGGHLVLVTGYDKTQKTIAIHNPSGFVSEDTQENHTLPTKDFVRFYAGRGIALSPQ